ncbi:hypothetical protein HD_1973 [[Haemophilus] ducreyi 35000HP]|uniref:Uncharacterized protein n=1 Tax=Haemophilus ducreyi (strain 35000HP / ATCC 700724) TaxID=233412 RepID=Q7VKE1_HAEDU|nr:hypothetical protein HD_1973 [[Haemophilus] ducreyi 35000HP]
MAASPKKQKQKATIFLYKSTINPQSLAYHTNKME